MGTLQGSDDLRTWRDIQPNEAPSSFRYVRAKFGVRFSDDEEVESLKALRDGEAKMSEGSMSLEDMLALGRKYGVMIHPEIQTGSTANVRLNLETFDPGPGESITFKAELPPKRVGKTAPRESKADVVDHTKRIKRRIRVDD